VDVVTSGLLCCRSDDAELSTDRNTLFLHDFSHNLCICTFTENDFSFQSTVFGVDALYKLAFFLVSFKSDCMKFDIVLHVMRINDGIGLYNFFHCNNFVYTLDQFS